MQKQTHKPSPTAGQPEWQAIQQQPDASAIGKRLVQIRIGYTQEQQAEYLQVHVNTLARYERGERLPQLAFLTRLAHCGVNLEWLLTGRGSPLFFGQIADYHQRVVWKRLMANSNNTPINEIPPVNER